MIIKTILLTLCFVFGSLAVDVSETVRFSGNNYTLRACIVCSEVSEQDVTLTVKEQEIVVIWQELPSGACQVTNLIGFIWKAGIHFRRTEKVTVATYEKDYIESHDKR